MTAGGNDPHVRHSRLRRPVIFGIAAVVAFLLAWILNAFHVGNDWIGPHPLLYLGAAFLAVHLLGVATGVPWRRST